MWHIYSLGSVVYTWCKELGYQQDSIWYILCSRISVVTISSLNFLWDIVKHVDIHCLYQLCILLIICHCVEVDCSEAAIKCNVVCFDIGTVQRPFL